MTAPDETPLSASEEEVRRLLASARHTGPLPREVAARLDGVLAGLAAGEHPDEDRDEPPAPAPVTDLDVHRRRRRVAQLLVAAAAVVVVGVGVNQVVEQTGGDSADSTSADAPSAAQEDSGAAGAGAQPSLPRRTPDSSGDAAVSNSKELAKVRPDSFDVDVRALQRSAFAGAPQDLTTDRAEAGAVAAGVACRSRTWGSGTFVPVSYGGSPAVLVLRKPQGDTQVADLYLCGSTTPVRSVTLPSP